MTHEEDEQPVSSTCEPNGDDCATPGIGQFGHSAARGDVLAYRSRVLARRPAAALALGALALTLAACGGARRAAHSVAVPEARPPSVWPSVATAVYPLTGRPVTDAGRAARPVLSVKIDNIGPALPQAGLNQADIVTDILVEGGLTRLMATFQSQDAPLIGPIRSARPVDADLLRELGGGIFAYSGAAPGEIAPSRAHSTALLVSNDNDPRWFWRASGRAAPHNVFSSTTRLYQAGHKLRPSLRTAPQLFSYSATPTTGTPATSVAIRMSPDSSAGWTWNGHDYVRTQDHRADSVVGGARVSTTDVVILSVTWSPTRIIDDAGNADPYVHIIGSGKAWVMRDGKVVAGRWVRPSYAVPMQLVDGTGQVIALAPGRTWLELEPHPYAPAFH